MKIIHIVNQDPAENILRVIEEQSKHHDVEVINMVSVHDDYDDLIDKIVACDRVISWGNAAQE